MTLERDITAAVEEAAALFAAHPERRTDLAEDYVMRGAPRPYPVLYLNRGPDPDAGDVTVRRAPVVRTPEERVLAAVHGMGWGLPMHNPMRPAIGLGVGPGTLAASFGIELDAELGYTPRGSRPLREVLCAGMPDPATSGIIPDMRAMIDAIQALTPSWVTITPPDRQGPFNLAHMILGDDAFIAPYEEPDDFAAFMALVTEFYIAFDANLRRWIEPARYPTFPGVTSCIAECSVNLISTDTYLEHVLPCDQRIAAYYGTVGIHPCSGPHVFYATMRHVPHIVYQEAGYIAKAAAGAISVDDALAEIGDRPIILRIGQELPAGDEEAFIRRDLLRARENPRLMFGYTGMHWKKADEPMIREMHLRLDAFWEEQVRA